MSYSLYIWDENRFNGAYWPETLAGVGKVLEALSEQAPKGPNARFERLAQHLLKHFPLPVEEPGPNARPEEIEAYHDAEESVWRGGNPLEEVRELQGAVWRPDIVTERAAEVLAVMLPMARELFLDVFDDSVGIYYPPPWRARDVVPPERKDVQLALDPGAANPVKYTKATIRKRFIDSLAPALASYGFVREPDPHVSIKFRRHIEGGMQDIKVLVSGSAPDYRCDIYLDSLSERYFKLRVAAVPPPEANPRFDFYGSAFSVSLDSLRRWVARGWRGAPETQYARSAQEIDWMVEDLLHLGLPLLDKARAIEGLDWLYCSEEARSICPVNMWRTEQTRSLLCFSVVTYARLAGNPRYKEIVHFVSTSGVGAASANPEGLQKIIEYCDTVEPVGSGPA